MQECESGESEGVYLMFMNLQSNRGGLKPTEALATLANAVKISISQLENPFASFKRAKERFRLRVFNRLIYEKHTLQFLSKNHKSMLWLITIS